MSHSAKISFVCFMRRADIHQNEAIFGLKIKKSSGYGLYCGTISVAISGDVDWHRNHWPFNKIKEQSYFGLLTFDDRLFKAVASLTVRIAIRFLKKK